MRSCIPTDKTQYGLETCAHLHSPALAPGASVRQVQVSSSLRSAHIVPMVLREREYMVFKWQKSLGGDQTLLRNKRRRMKYLTIRLGAPDSVFPLAQEVTAFPSRIYDDDHDHRSHRHN